MAVFCVTASGLRAVSVDEYADEAVEGAASQQQLSAILLFGVTRRQLTSRVVTESMFVMATALLIGTVSVLPAQVGVAYGMLGRFDLAIDWPIYEALAAAVVLIASIATVLLARFAIRPR